MERFIEAYTNAFQRYADFRGRTGLGGFWRYFATAFVIGLILGGLGSVSTFFWILYAVYIIIVLVPSLAIGCRRLHDTGRTGWLLLLYLLPVIGFILLVVFWIQESDGPNQYGTGPED
jgi:uncharacterized membrane protein YhaH (DUF805 family)